jgi:hypothetical protein
MADVPMKLFLVYRTIIDKLSSHTPFGKRLSENAFGSFFKNHAPLFNSLKETG